MMKESICLHRYETMWHLKRLSHAVLGRGLAATAAEPAVTMEEAVHLSDLAREENLKQVGVAAWLECWLSHLGVAGSSPGHDNL